MLKKIIFALLLCFAFTNVNAKITAKVDQTSLIEGDLVILTISPVNINKLGVDTLALIEKDFDIWSKGFTSSFVYDGNEQKNESSFILELLPKKTGKVVIPSLLVEGERTNAINLEVIPFKTTSKANRAIVNRQNAVNSLVRIAKNINQRMININQTSAATTLRNQVHDQFNQMFEQTMNPAPVSQNPTPAVQNQPLNQTNQPVTTDKKDVFITVSVDNKTPFIGEQVIYKIKVFDSLNIAGSTLEMPKSIDKVIDAEKTDILKKGSEVINGIVYSTYETSVILFPLTTDEISIPASVYSMEIAERRSGSFDFNFPMLRFGPKKKVSINSDVIKIKPKAKIYSDKPWLVAKEITINEKLTPEKSTYKVGESITRTITINAKGQISRNIPKINKIDSEKYNIYPSKSKDTDNFEDESIGATTLVSQDFVIVPLETGELKLPNYEISYYNSGKNKFETVRTASPLLLIEKGLGRDNLITDDINKIDENIEKDIAKLKKDFNPIQIIKDNMIVASMVLIIILLIFLLLRKKGENSSETNKYAPEKKGKTVIKDEIIVETNLKKELKEAVGNHDALKAKNTAIKLYNEEFSTNFTTIEKVAEDLNSDILNNQINLLNTSLYSREKIKWQGKDFLSAFDTAIKNKKDENTKTPVPKLYPF